MGYSVTSIEGAEQEAQGILRESKAGGKETGHGGAEQKVHSTLHRGAEQVDWGPGSRQGMGKKKKQKTAW